MTRQMPKADVVDDFNVIHRYVIIHNMERKPDHVAFSTHGTDVIDMLTIPRPNILFVIKYLI